MRMQWKRRIIEELNHISAMVSTRNLSKKSTIIELMRSNEHDTTLHSCTNDPHAIPCPYLSPTVAAARAGEA